MKIKSFEEWSKGEYNEYKIVLSIRDTHLVDLLKKFNKTRSNIFIMLITSIRRGLLFKYEVNINEDDVVFTTGSIQFYLSVSKDDITQVDKQMIIDSLIEIIKNEEEAEPSTPLFSEYYNKNIDVKIDVSKVD